VDIRVIIDSQYNFIHSLSKHLILFIVSTTIIDNSSRLKLTKQTGCTVLIFSSATGYNYELVIVKGNTDGSILENKTQMVLHAGKYDSRLACVRLKSFGCL